MMAAIMGIGRFAYTPLLPPMQDTLGWSVAQAGDVASANFVGYLLGAFITSSLAQSSARRFWLLLAFVFSAVTTAAGFVVDTYAGWMAIRFASGLASAFCLVLGTATVMEKITAHSRASLGAVHFAGVGIGIVFSVLVIEWAESAGLSVFAQWGVLGAASALLLTLAWMAFGRLPGPPGESNEVLPVKSTGKSRASQSLKRLIIAYGLFGFGYVVTATFIVAIARQMDNAALFEPLTWIVVGVFAAVSIYVWQGVAVRLGVIEALRLALAMEAVGVLLAGMVSGPFAILVGGALLGGTFVAISALGFVAARQLATGNEGRVIGWMTAAFGGGQLLGPAVAGRLAEYTEGFAAPSLLAASLLMIGVILLKNSKRE